MTAALAREIEWLRAQNQALKIQAAAMQEEIGQLRKVVANYRSLLCESRLDLFYWLQLAEKQRQELPDVDHFPCGPTTHGMEHTRQLREKIAQSFQQYSDV